MTQPMSIAEINLVNFSKNIEAVKKSISRNQKICVMLKANAYGHGSIEMAQQCLDSGVEYIGVATPFEGAELRKAGIKLPIIVFDGILPSHVQMIMDFCLTPTVFNMEILNTLQMEAAKKDKILPVHIQYDTGFSRIGIYEDELQTVLERLKECKNIYFEGFYTHFIKAGSSDKAVTQRQLEKFEKGVCDVKNAGFSPMIHMSNSAGIFEFGQCNFDMVRPGIMLYGYYPTEYIKKEIKLYPVMQWKTHIIQVQTIPENTGVSYNSMFITKRPTKIATIPVGYADGLKRQLGNNGYVLANGKRAPIIGIVCMDMCMIDITDIDGVKTGDEIVLLGKQGEDEISADEMAKWANTISYEILTSLGTRVQKVYIRKSIDLFG